MGGRESFALPILLFMTGRIAKRDGWFSEKAYQHFDLPWKFERALDYVSDHTNIENHSFLPFLSFEIVVRRFDGTTKSRPIRFASHRDNYVYGYYAKRLNILYEKQLQDNELSRCVLAYRSGIGNNISFANEAFSQILSLGTCVAIGFDVRGFFDNLDHDLLKERWQELVGNTKLTKSDYAIFKSITKYAYVDRQECYRRLQYNQTQRREKKPICDSTQFKKIIKGRGQNESSLISKNSERHGIPQGSAISACLANIYMIHFDTTMKRMADLGGGQYRRYSDDLLFIMPIEYEQTVRLVVEQELKKIKLEIAENKTLISHFNRMIDGTMKLRYGDKALQYLGFTFDGQTILLRSQTLSRYWQKTTKAVNTARKDAAKAARKGRTAKIFRRQIFRRYTHLGNGNFLSYVRRAAQAIDSANYKKSKIWKQTKNHFSKIQTMITE